jgi:hypothetical protein
MHPVGFGQGRPRQAASSANGKVWASVVRHLCGETLILQRGKGARVASPLHTRDLRLIKARVLVNLSPGGPEEGGKRYQHFEEIVGALRVQFFRSEFMHSVFLMIVEVFASGASKSG